MSFLRAKLANTDRSWGTLSLTSTRCLRNTPTRNGGHAVREVYCFWWLAREHACRPVERDSVCKSILVVRVVVAESPLLLEEAADCHVSYSRILGLPIPVISLLYVYIQLSLTRPDGRGAFKLVRQWQRKWLTCLAAWAHDDRAFVFARRLSIPGHAHYAEHETHVNVDCRMFLLTVLATWLFSAAGLGGGCVGTIAGIPLHNPDAGSAALLSALSLTYAAIVDPANPSSVIVPVSGAVFRVGPNGTTSTLAGGESTDVSSTPVGFAAFAHTVALLGATLAAASSRNKGIYIADESSIWLLNTSDDGQLSKISSALQPQCLHVDDISGDLYYCAGKNSVKVLRASSGFTNVETVIESTLK